MLDPFWLKIYVYLSKSAGYDYNMNMLSLYMKSIIITAGFIFLNDIRESSAVNLFVAKVQHRWLNGWMKLKMSLEWVFREGHALNCP